MHSENGTARGADVVVVGAGHNGMVAACYLARAGLDVLVVEARASAIAGDLQLQRFGLEQLVLEAPHVHPPAARRGHRCARHAVNGTAAVSAVDEPQAQATHEEERSNARV